jgi:hypothetical protein
MFIEFQQKFSRKLTNCFKECLLRYSDVTLLVGNRWQVSTHPCPWWLSLGFSWSHSVFVLSVLGCRAHLQSAILTLNTTISRLNNNAIFIGTQQLASVQARLRMCLNVTNNPICIEISPNFMLFNYFRQQICLFLYCYFSLEVEAVRSDS